MRPLSLLPRLAPLALLFLLAAPRTGLPAEESSLSSPAFMPELIGQFEADQASVREAFDLPASAESLDRLQRLLAAWQAKLRKLDFAKLDPAGKVDYLLLANDLDRSLAHVSRDRARLAEMEPLLTFRHSILTLETTRRQAGPLDLRDAATKIEQLGRDVMQLRQRVEKGRKAGGDGTHADASRSVSAAETPLAVSAELALRTARTVERLSRTLKSWFGFYDGYRPDFAWWMRKPYDEAQKELEAYAKLLREEIAGQKGKDDDPLVGEPLGAAALAEEIRFQWLPYSAEELIAIGQRELDWCEGQMKVNSRAMGLGEDWKAALARVKSDYAPPGKQDELIARIAREATDFVRRRNLVEVPLLCRESWRLAMVSPEGLKTLPYAAYGGRDMLVAYANAALDQDEKLMVMRGNNRHFMRLVTPHELIPGHHLQGFFGQRYNTYRQLFGTPFYIEGWALYWELRLFDLGWAQTPEDRIGMLFWRMHRAARILVTLRYQLGKMTPAEMIDFLVQRVGHERLGATSEVRRFLTAEPLYQAGYLLGGLQLYSLNKDLVGGGKMSETQFHGAVLRQNTIPIELLRAALLGLPLSRESKPSWRFQDEAMR
jgi:uncharacterized protein (DUF885 family)